MWNSTVLVVSTVLRRVIDVHDPRSSLKVNRLRGYRAIVARDWDTRRYVPTGASLVSWGNHAPLCNECVVNSVGPIFAVSADVGFLERLAGSWKYALSMVVARFVCGNGLSQRFPAREVCKN